MGEVCGRVEEEKRELLTLLGSDLGASLRLEGGDSNLGGSGEEGGVGARVLDRGEAARGETLSRTGDEGHFVPSEFWKE